jgi:general secretion pathway protein K
MSRGRRRTERRGSGIALVIVIFFVMLFTTAVTTFVRRASVDSLVARHRDAAREAEALARGGVALAQALLLEDRLQEQAESFRAETSDDLWARAGAAALPVGDHATLRLRILDPGNRLNVNALFADGKLRDPIARVLLEDLFRKVVDEMPGRPEDKAYEPRDLVERLVDFIDADSDTPSGAFEDDVYQRAEPPYRAANRPLLSLDELQLVEGFDGALVEALRPYLTVHPYGGGEGINPNTAPPHVLGLLYHGVSEDYRLVDARQVEDLLKARETGALWCDESATDERCRPLTDVVPGTLFPPATYSSDVFTVLSTATVGEVTRTLEVVVDRSAAEGPALVAWRMH